MSGYQVGQVVQLTNGETATIRFVGPTEFQQGEWIGVEFDDPNGKNDGSVKGVRYFDCEPDKGMFLRPVAIMSIIEQAPAPKAAAPAKRASRPSSVVGPGVGRRGSIVPDTGVNKRMSMNAASPSPAARPGSRPSSMIRVSLASASKLCNAYFDSLLQNLPRNNYPRTHQLLQLHEPALLRTREPLL